MQPARLALLFLAAALAAAPALAEDAVRHVPARDVPAPVTPTVIGGINAFLVTPETIAEANRDRPLVHVHGGGYVLSPASAANPKFAKPCGALGCELRVQSGTRIIDWLVSL